MLGSPALVTSHSLEGFPGRQFSATIGFAGVSHGKGANASIVAPDTVLSALVLRGVGSGAVAIHDCERGSRSGERAVLAAGGAASNNRTASRHATPAWDEP